MAYASSKRYLLTRLAHAGLSVIMEDKKNFFILNGLIAGRLTRPRMMSL